MLGVPFDIVGLSYEKFLVSVGIMDPPLYASMCFNVVMLLLSYLFIDLWHLDYQYIALSFVVGTMSRTLFSVSISIRLPDVQRTLSVPSLEIFSNWGEFFRLGLPGCALLW
jgi:Na+-driven multidrug efflux pump